MVDIGKVGAALVIGGGIGGIQAALDLAESGFYVYLVEKSPSIGGVMAQLDKTFPTNDCSMCILSPKLVEAASHPNIGLYCCSEVEDIEGGPGHFRARVRRKATYVDWNKCTGCGVCAEWCPVAMPNRFNEGLDNNRAIYTAFPQAVPKKYVINKTQDRLCHAACSDACPLHMNVSGYLKLTAAGEIDEAYRLIRATNPLPAVCGRVCYAPCQEACNRGQIDDHPAIRDIKRFVVDHADVSKLQIARADSTGKKVAIVGSGPAGLTAAHDLALKGHGVTVFEALPKAGGMLQVGIPEYRLPKEIVDREIGQIEGLGVQIRTGVRVGKDIAPGKLRKEFDALFIAVGAHRGTSLRVPGEDLDGVVQGVDFLRQVALGEPVAVPDSVAVIGAGNTAIDCARTARRLGARTVTIYYRRTRDEMPAAREEVEVAEWEGVEMELLVSPTAFRGGEGTVEAEFIRMRLGEPDASGRPRPIPIDGSEFSLPFGLVIAATGQAPEVDFVRELGVAVSKSGTITVDAVGKATNVRGIYAAGDAVTGPAYVVDAMAAGRRAATAIDAYLNGVAPSYEAEPQPRKLTELEMFKIRRTVELTRRTGMGELPPDQRSGFAEVATGYTLQQAQMEAGRCLAGMGEGCIGCQECVRRCAAKAVDHDMTDQIVEIDVGAVLLSGGFECYDSAELYDLGYKRLPNVVTSLEFERILSASGPFEGVLRRPSDLVAPHRVAFLQCVGSRDAKHHRPYCSSVCCTYAIKEAMIAKEHSPVPVDIDIFMMDLRTYGKDFERYYERARDDSGVNFIRAKAFSVNAVDGSGELSISYADESGYKAARYDMVVLSQGFQPSPGLVTLAKKIGVQLNQYGFCQTVPFSPMETSRPGIYTCGAFSAPRDIPETVTQASGAAGDISALLSSARNTMVKPKEYPPERDVSAEEPRIGVFVCHCGINIGGYVNVDEVAEFARLQPNVVHAECNLFTCSQDTQDRIKSSIAQHGLNRVIVASCSPRTHERLFQETLRESGLNPYLFEMANIRDQCSWVHMHEREQATAKAKDLVSMAIAKTRLIGSLKPVSVPVNHAAVVVGGGVAGMTAALELADQGFDVHLIERTGQLGGLAKRILYSIEKGNVTEFISETVARVNKHPHITVHCDTWIVDVNGYVGNFGVDVMKYRGRGTERLDSGVIIIATGAHEYRPTEYLYGRDARVLTQLELAEEMDRQNPDIVTSGNVVMVQCVGSRNENHPYCSRVCCNQSIKNALKLRELNPQANIYVLFRDMRTYGFYEDYYQEARRAGVIFLRFEAGHEPAVTRERVDGKLLIRVEIEDPILGNRLAIHPDYLVLSAGIEPCPEAKELATACKVPVNQDGFFLEAHVKLRPVDFANDGMFVCGTAHAPKSIEESIAQAKAAAARATTILVRETLAGIATVCSVDELYCAGCGVCQAVCPYGAVAVDPERRVSVVNEALCKGCGTCAAACPAGACRQRGFRSDQISAMLAAALEEI